MIEFAYKPDDMRYIFMKSNVPAEIMALEKFLNKIPPYMFLPSFSGIPRQVVFLNKVKKGTEYIYYCHSGLWKTIVDWCDANRVVTKGIDKNFKYRPDMCSREELEKLVESWELNIKPRAYQLDAAWKILSFRQSLSQLATRAGKTLIAYIIFRYMIEKCNANKILMIVPNTSLVKQGLADFKEYKDFFIGEGIWSGGEEVAFSNVTIGTFQSLVKKADKKSAKYNPKWFDQFDVVCVDEAHTLKCESINTILNQNFLKSVKIKFGFSGSLPKEETIESFCCHSLMGPTIQDIRSSELMEEGFIRPVNITQIRIKNEMNDELQKLYIRNGEYLCSNVKKDSEGKEVQLPADQQHFTIKYEKTLPFALRQARDNYEDSEYMQVLVDMCKAKGSNLLNLEQMLVFDNKKRLDVIYRLLNSFNKNCIVFAHHTEYLKYMCEHFKSLFPNKQIFLINGSTSVKKRGEIIETMKTNSNCVLFASYQCVGTGLTFKNLDYGIFAESFKSDIINKQSVGRGLGLYGQETPFELYDIIDVFPTGRLESQGRAKISIYKDEKWNYKIENV